MAAILLLALLCTFLHTPSSVLTSDAADPPAGSCVQVQCSNDQTQQLLLEHLETLETKLNDLDNKLSQIKNVPNCLTTSCYKGMAGLGLEPRIPIQVFGSWVALCDTETDGGGWIVIQRRMNGDVDFYRNWRDYRSGFGTVTTDYWLGLEAIHQLTTSGEFELRVDMTYNGKDYASLASTFQVGDEKSNYRLSVGGYSGDATEALDYNNNMPFTTKDRDNDYYQFNCAQIRHGGWWYNKCGLVNLNGKWAAQGDNGMHYYGVVWTGSVTSSEIKIRPR